MAGKITIYMGCMYSGKTSALISSCRRHLSIDRKILVINYAGDNRYSEFSEIVSHNKDKISCLKVNKLGDINLDLILNVESIMIDEGQFFTDLFEYVSQWADELDVHVVIAGLDGTSERTPFGDMLKLIPHAEEVERLTAFCSECRDGTVAVYSKYFGETAKDENGVAIGGAEAYRPVCRKHYRPF